MSFGGGSSRTPAPQEVTTQTSNLPEYVEPYYKRLLKRRSRVITGLYSVWWSTLRILCSR